MSSDSVLLGSTNPEKILRRFLEGLVGMLLPVPDHEFINIIEIFYTSRVAASITGQFWRGVLSKARSDARSSSASPRARIARYVPREPAGQIERDRGGRDRE